MDINALLVSAPLPPTAISLDQSGLAVSAHFEVPVTKAYPIILRFKFPDTQSRLNDTIVGRTYNEYCRKKHEDIPPERREDLGKPIPIRIVIKKQPDGTVVTDQVFQSLCASGFDGENRKYRNVGSVTLEQGKYSAEFYNLIGQPELANIPSEVMLAGGQGK